MRKFEVQVEREAPEKSDDFSREFWIRQREITGIGEKSIRSRRKKKLTRNNHKLEKFNYPKLRNSRNDQKKLTYYKRVVWYKIIIKIVHTYLKLTKIITWYEIFSLNFREPSANLVLFQNPDHNFREPSTIFLIFRNPNHNFRETSTIFLMFQNL